MSISLEECKQYKGYLKKKSPSLLGGWQKRYFRVLDGRVIVYSEKENDNKPKGQIQVLAISRPEATEDCVFKFTLDGRDFILKAESNEERDKWVQVISTLIKDLERRGPRMSTPNVASMIDHGDEDFIRKRTSTVKANKMEAIDKNTMELLKNYGLGKDDEEEQSLKILKEKGFDRVLNLKNPKIECRIHHGFLYKKHKTHNIFQKRWFFICSHRPLTDDKYEIDETNLNLDGGKKEKIEFDCLLYFTFDDNDNDPSESKGSLDLALSHKIESTDREEKYYLVLDIEDRVFELYSDTKAKRDKWFEILKNSRRTAKEFKSSGTGDPRNIELLNSKFTKSPEEFNKKMEEEKNQIVGDYKLINEYKILEFTLTNFEKMILSTVDGCNSNQPRKIELCEAYTSYMNSQYLLIIQYFWENQFNNIDSNDILKLAMKLFEFSSSLSDIHLIDSNLEKNGRELVKIYMKKTFKNILDVIENILKSEREIKAIKNEEGQYCTNGPNDLFDILSKTFDLIKEYKNKYIYSQSFNLFHECIIQYLIGVDCVTSNHTIEVDKEFLLGVANNSYVMIQLLNQLIDDAREMGISTEDEINEEIQIKKIMSSINLMSQNAIFRFVSLFNDDLSKCFEGKNYLELDMTSVLVTTNNIFGNFNQCMNSMIMKKTWEEILKSTIFYYIKSLLTTAYKKLKKIEDLIAKIKYDQGLLNETYEPVVGKNLTVATLKILSDILDFLEISSYMISSSCLTLREYIGPSFSISTAKALINLRCDFSSDEKKDAIAQCKDVLEKYVDQGNKGIGFFDKMEEEIRVENEDPNEAQLEKVDQEEKEKEAKTVGISLDDFLKDENEEEEEPDETTNENQTQQTEEVEEISDIVYEGTMKKKSHSKWQERFFQLKNGYLYWFKDKNSSMKSNKISLEKTLRVESHKENKFLMVVADDLEKGKNTGKIYKFACENEEEKQGWITALTNEMKRIKGESKVSQTNIEMKPKKKVIVDKFNLPDLSKLRMYMKNKTEALMTNENYFKPAIKKAKGKKPDSRKTSVTGSMNESSGDPRAHIHQFNVEEIPQKKDDEGIFSCCKKCLDSIFGNKEPAGQKEHLAPK